MGFKCAPQVLGLVRGEPKPGQKHRANGMKIAKEAGYERASKSDTLDRTRSDLNEYEGYRSGKEFWEAMETEAAAYRVQVPGKTKTGEPIIREKGLQHNAVIGWAVIYNPPAEVCRDWTQEQYSIFFSDCRECMAEISPIFRKDNIRMSALHLDEGIPPEQEGDFPDGHMHDLGVCKDEDGRYIGSQIDAKLLIKINTEFPAMMRQRGWEMDDMDTTDFERAKIDSEYRAERDYKRGQSGKSVNQHIRKKAEMTLDEAEEIRDAYTGMVAEVSDRMKEMDAEQQELDTRQIALDAQEKDVKRDRERLDNIEKEQQETSERLKHQERTNRRVYKFIYEFLHQLGDERTKFSTISEMEQAIESAKEKFISSVQEDADVKASDKAAAEFQVKEDQLEAQRAALMEREELVDQQEDLSSPSGAALFVLREVQKKCSDPAVERFVSFVMNYITMNKSDINVGYGSYIQEIREKRQVIKTERDVILHHDEKEDQNSVSL